MNTSKMEKKMDMLAAKTNGHALRGKGRGNFTRVYFIVSLLYVNMS